MRFRERLTPYLLLGALTLGTGLGVGLGLSEAPTHRAGWFSYGPDAAAVTAARSPDGILTGVATPCIGLATAAQYARMPVAVTLNEGTRTVASETVSGSGFDALAAAHSRALAKISRDIAAAIRTEAAAKP